MHEQHESRRWRVWCRVGLQVRTAVLARCSGVSVHIVQRDSLRYVSCMVQSTAHAPRVSTGLYTCCCVAVVLNGIASTHAQSVSIIPQPVCGVHNYIDPQAAVTSRRAELFCSQAVKLPHFFRLSCKPLKIISGVKSRYIFYRD